MSAIEIDRISKQFGVVKALDDIQLEVESGELFGLIGPDGAGKTTLFRILTTLLLPDKGSARVEGMDVVKDFKAIRKSVGYMPGRFSLYQDLTVEENLRFFARVFGTELEENYELIRDIYDQIKPFRKRRAGQLSGGMKQKLALSCALIHRPSILFLDEPTTGVDAVSRREFWDMLRGLREKGITILVSTPYMDEAGRCDRIALIQKGRILSVDTPDGITERFGKPLFAVRSGHLYALLRVLREWNMAESVFPFGEYLHLVTRGLLGVEDIRNYLAQQGHPDAEIKSSAATIEDCFMDLMAATVH